jgi:predicted amidophosphoribosyltransferase
MFLSDVLGGLLRPARCLACGAPAAWPCCARCLPPVPGDIGPWPLAADPEVPLWALGPYRDALRAAVLAGKLDDQPAALTELGRRLGDALAVAGVGADLVTYVAAARVAGPPRDHAERIAAGVAAALDLPLVGLLAPSGGRDLGRARRAARPYQQPPARPPPTARYRLAGGRVLLVDDLATTGGTLAGAAATLRVAGARRVEAAVLATTPAALRAAVGPRGPPGPAPLASGPASVRVPPPPLVPFHAAREAWIPWPGCLVVAVWPGFALLTPVALCGCDLISCVESGQYDQRAVKEDGPYAEVIWQDKPCDPFGLQGSMGGYGRLAIISGYRIGSCQCR